MSVQVTPDRLFNRELSWLAFNRRVLDEARHPGTPLLERARFLAIVSSNLDEFVMVRLAKLRWHGSDLDQDPAGLSPAEQLDSSRRELRAQAEDQYRCWRDEIAPALAAEGVAIVPACAWSSGDRETLAAYWRERLEPVLTPLAVDPARPFPLLAGGGIHIAVLLRPDNEPDDQAAPLRALVTVPIRDRLLALVEGGGRWALVEDLVGLHLGELFPGYRIIGQGVFRLTRDGGIELDEDAATDLLHEMEEGLRQRGHGRAVRLELPLDAPATLRVWLMEALDLTDADLVEVDGPLDLRFLAGLDRQLPRPDLAYRPFEPAPSPAGWQEDPFAVLTVQDVALHHPFDGFQAVVELVELAAEDPRVLAIKQTLYRVSGDSALVRALMRAARNGKQVTVLIELKARFDEETNIRWAKRLEQAGAHVLYGVIGYKVHAKLLMIIRNEAEGIRRYCHIGTGNYNDKTTRMYTDIGVMSANPAIGRDVAAVFNLLTGFSVPPQWERLVVSPLTMRRDVTAWIRREAEHARRGLPARIAIKFNNLVDVDMIELFYAASQAGVEIDLIVRGICMLRAGVPGLSERIRVRSIIGRFLEHSRIYHFLNHGAEPVWLIGSADLMPRNIDRRVETMVQIEDRQLQAHLASLLDLYLADNASARVLQPDGSYLRLQPGDAEALAVQDHLLDLARQAGTQEATERRPTTVFVPARRPQP